MRDTSVETSTLFALMARQHGVASRVQLRAVGVSAAVERRLLRQGAITAPWPHAVAAGGAPLDRRGALLAATMRPGVVAVSHGAAAREHGLSAFRHHEPIDVIGGRGARLTLAAPVITHYTRGPLRDHVVAVDGIRLVSLPLTLVHVAPQLGRHRIADAIAESIGRGVAPAAIGAVAEAWQATGRPGPAIVLAALDSLRGRQTPRSSSSAADHGSSVRAATASASSAHRWGPASSRARW